MSDPEAPAPDYHLLLEADEVLVAASALRLLISDEAHEPEIRALAREVIDGLAAPQDERGRITLTLTPRQMKITHSASRLLLNDLQRGQADERAVLWHIIEKLPDEHVMRAIEIQPTSVADTGLVCVVEIPKGGRNKYEYDPQLGGIKFDRLLMSAATYPADYGFLRGTLGQDGDPLDALVCLYEPTFPGCLIPVKPVGLFDMRDEKGVDHKVICVPLGDPYWNHHEQLEDLPLLLRQEIEQFFSIYKDLEGEEVEIGGWRSREDAEREIASARQRLHQQTGS